ncbi:MAG: hypothetical protein JO057_10185 [Chloroflexi bacterium]|nr:hypothetical protein [Chloroflexota bacterium]
MAGADDVVVDEADFDTCHFVAEADNVFVRDHVFGDGHSAAGADNVFVYLSFENTF